MYFVRFYVCKHEKSTGSCNVQLLVELVDFCNLFRKVGLSGMRDVEPRLRGPARVQFLARISVGDLLGILFGTDAATPSYLSEFMEPMLVAFPLRGGHYLVLRSIFRIYV